MPPKPKGKDDKKKGEEPPADDGQERELVEKELVIGYLKSKLGRYQEFGDKLQVDNLKLNEELETQKLNLRDINEFLTNELKARSLTTSALEAKVYELNQQMEDVKKNNEEALAKQEKDKDAQIEALEGRIKEYEKKSRATQDFLDRKDMMEAELQGLREGLDTKIREYTQQLTDIDRQHIQDREKWKRETAQKIKETKIQMMKLTDNQLEMTTKRTIMENEQMSVELAYQSRQTEKLLAKNNMLLEENSDLRRNLELSKQTEQELAKRNNVYQKTIKSLLTKLKEQGMQQEESGGVVSELEAMISDLESALHLARLQVDDMEHKLMKGSQQLHDKTAQMESWTSQHDQAMHFLMSCLEDVKSKIVTVERPDSPGYDDRGLGDDVSVIPGSLDDLGPEQRERVLGHLLERLQVFTKVQQLEAATSAPPPSYAQHTLSSSAAAPGHGKGLSPRADLNHASTGSSPGGVTLPVIPSYSKRGAQGASLSASSKYPQGFTAEGPPWLNASGGKAGGPAGFHSPQQARGSGGVGGSYQAGDVEAAGGEASHAAVPEGLPPVEDLLARVMSDVRPWGKRSNNSNALSGGRTTGRPGMFMKSQAATRS